MKVVHGTNCACTPCTIEPEDWTPGKIGDRTVLESRLYKGKVYHKTTHYPADEEAEPLICHDPETCVELHNETEHHYGCECEACMMEAWMMKR